LCLVTTLWAGRVLILVTLSARETIICNMCTDRKTHLISTYTKWITTIGSSQEGDRPGVDRRKCQRIQVHNVSRPLALLREQDGGTLLASAASVNPRKEAELEANKMRRNGGKAR
jgi:hypothetical protein